MTTLSILSTAGTNGGNLNGNGVAGGNGTAGQSVTDSFTTPDSTGNILTVTGAHGRQWGRWRRSVPWRQSVFHPGW
jgi:hypothetical protein